MNNMTALVSAFARAYHTEKYTVPIFSDPIAGMLLGEDYQQIAQTMAQGIRFFAPDFQGSEEEALRLIVDRQLSPAPLGRAAFAERSLKTAVALGTEQYLLFGAGYDTFALRQPEWAQKLQIFELDLPESVADKQQRIQKAGLSIPENTFYLPMDLSQEEWQKIGTQELFSGKTEFLQSVGTGLLFAQRGVRKPAGSFAGSFAGGQRIGPGLSYEAGRGSAE